MGLRELYGDEEQHFGTGAALPPGVSKGRTKK